MSAKQTFSTSKCRMVFVGLLAGALLVACSRDSEPPLLNTATELAPAPTMLVFKSPTCGCCQKWVDHITDADFLVEVKNMRNLQPIKSQYEIDPGLQSCHTAVYDGYIFEGHIPAEIIVRFLEEKPPNARGLAVPGMPVGGPGMEMGSRRDAYNVLQLNEDGSTYIYQHVSSDHDMSDTSHGEHNDNL